MAEQDLPPQPRRKAEQDLPPQPLKAEQDLPPQRGKIMMYAAGAGFVGALLAIVVLRLTGFL